MSACMQTPLPEKFFGQESIGVVFLEERREGNEKINIRAVLGE